MPNRKTTRAAQGAGTVRKKTVTRNGQPYTYWEARVTTGRDPGTGKQIQKSFSGKTQKEVREKMQSVAVAVNEKTYIEPSKLTLGQWLDIWEAEYLGDIKPLTLASYKRTVKNHIKPALGAIKLQALSAHEIQGMYNAAQRGDKPLAPKTIKNLHGVTHKALQQAVELGYIKFNPADACKLPRAEKRDIKPLDEQQIKAFLQIISGHKFEYLYLVTLFTGMREGEVLGLTWDCIDFKAGTVLINKQLIKNRDEAGEFELASTKNGKSRKITPAPFVMRILKDQQQKQLEERFRAQGAWCNDWNLVFTDELGGHLSAVTVYNNFKRLAKQAGFPEARFHDLRHSYAVAALQSGDDIKTVQENLGHHAAAFTLDVYGHVTERMKEDSAARMEAFINGVSNL